ncbi:hypothetical protein L2E82_51531 [Cichorium intybus]|nr:hypothetical protein L2E82_51531 [Cichorium intybus]
MGERWTKALESGTDSYLVVQSLPTFDDMRFKTPLNKVKAADPDFLDPSSGWAVDRGEWMSREGIIVFQLIWNITEQLRVPVPVPDAAPSSVAKTQGRPSPIRPRKLYLIEWTYQHHASKKVSNSARDSHWQLYPTLHQPVCVSFAPYSYSSTPPPATFVPLPPIGIPAVKPLSSFLTLLPIKSLLRQAKDRGLIKVKISPYGGSCYPYSSMAVLLAIESSLAPAFQQTSVQCEVLPFALLQLRTPCQSSAREKTSKPITVLRALIGSSKLTRFSSNCIRNSGEKSYTQAFAYRMVEGVRGSNTFCLMLDHCIRDISNEFSIYDEEFLYVKIIGGGKNKGEDLFKKEDDSKRNSKRRIGCLKDSAWEFSLGLLISSSPTHKNQNRHSKPELDYISIERKLSMVTLRREQMGSSPSSSIPLDETAVSNR